MKKPTYSDQWQESWKLSYQYDLVEVYGSRASLGYTYAYKNRQKHTIELVKKILHKDSKILDVAAASGNFSLLLAELGYDVTWNDLRGELIDYVKLKHEKGVINYVSGNVFDLNFDSHFDLILITEVIEHVAHPDQFLRKIAKLVKPNGYIIMTTPNGEYIRNNLPRFSDCPDPSIFEDIQFKPNSDGHIFLLHLDEVENLAQQTNLCLKEMYTITNILTNGHIKTHYLLTLLPSYIVNLIESMTLILPSFLNKKINTTTVALMQRQR